MEYQDKVWQTDELTQTYLAGVRGAIPLAQEQIEVMLRLIRAACPTATAILDLGCGDGILGQAVSHAYPQASTVFADFSEPMLQAARQRMDGDDHATFVKLDYGQRGWEKSLPQNLSQYEVIISGFSIHHQPDQRKKEVYSEIFELLAPGGIFLNLEHVASHSDWVERQFEEFFIDSLHAYHQGIASGKTRQQVDQEFYSRPDKAANILAPVEDQCRWLREIGFVHVDCYLKVFELALFGGLKPDALRDTTRNKQD
jgi:ubiquinone/menaquinone biosynthesis C-methylase UbiE